MIFGVGIILFMARKEKGRAGSRRGNARLAVCNGSGRDRLVFPAYGLARAVWPD